MFCTLKIRYKYKSTDTLFHFRFCEFIKDTEIRLYLDRFIVWYNLYLILNVSWTFIYYLLTNAHHPMAKAPKWIKLMPMLTIFFQTALMLCQCCLQAKKINTETETNTNFLLIVAERFEYRKWHKTGRSCALYVRGNIYELQNMEKEGEREREREIETKKK